MKSVTLRNLNLLAERVFAVKGRERTDSILTRHATINRRNLFAPRRRALWAALHNELNRGYGRQKLHRWTERNTGH